MSENVEVVPRTTDDWLAAQTGVNIFKTESGQTCISFDPAFANRFNFLTPISQVMQLDPNWRPVPRVLQLNPAKHAYRRKGKFDLTKQGLGLLADLAGIEKDGEPSWNYMDGKGVRVTVRARQRKSDGTWRHGAGTITVWFERAEAKIRREAAGASENEVEKRIDEFYDHCSSKAETRAWLRSVRELLGLPGEFTEAELRRPFFVIGYAFVPDWTNPHIARMLNLQFGDGSRDLYGSEPEVQSLPEAVKPAPRELAPSTGEFDADVDGDDWDGIGGEEAEVEPDFGPGVEIVDAVEVPPVAPTPPTPPQKPEVTFTPLSGPYQNVPVEAIVGTADGRVWIAAALAKMEDPVKRQQGLDWLSFALGRQVTMADLSSVA